MNRTRATHTQSITLNFAQIRYAWYTLNEKTQIPNDLPFQVALKTLCDVHGMTLVETLGNTLDVQHYVKTGEFRQETK